MCVYLSRPQISLVDTTKSSFAQQFFITEWACCFLHFFECINWWSMASFCRWSLILYLPTFNWFIYPWKRQNQKEKKMKINPEKKKSGESEEEAGTYMDYYDPQTCFFDACSKLRPDQKAWFFFLFMMKLVIIVEFSAAATANGMNGRDRRLSFRTIWEHDCLTNGYSENKIKWRNQNR